MKRPTILLLCLWTISLSISLRAQGNFVYTNNHFGPRGSFTNTVSGFSVGSDGSLTEIAGSPFPTGDRGNPGIRGSNYITVVDRFLYAANPASGSVTVFLIDPVSGALTLVPGDPSPKPESMNGMSLAATPDGRFLIVTDSLLNAFVVNAIAPDGSLSPVGERHLVPDPIGGIKVSPDGRFLALAILSGIAMYAIEPNGHVIPVPGSPFPKTGRGLTTTIDINCDGSLLFATDRGGYSRDEVTEGKAITAHVYAIRPNGSLLHLGATPSIAGFGEFATYLILSPDGRTLFVSDTFASSVAAFRVGISGALSLVPGSPFSIGTIQGFDPNPWGMIMNPSGSLLYFAISRNRVGGFEAARDGSLRVLPTSPTIPRSLEGSSASTLTLAYFPASGCAAPVLTIRNVNFTGKKLAIIGSGLVNSTRVFINGADRTAFVKSISDTKVKINGKKSALGLTVGDNIVQVTNPDDLLSNVFVLRL